MSAKQRTGPSRRTMIKSGLAGFVAAGASGLRIAEAQTPPARSSGPLFFDVDTTNGKVHGIANTGIKIFRGIPYGADTAGKNRFMPPRKPATWTGVRNCIGYGPISPQTLSGYRSRLLADDHVGPPRRLRRHGRRLPHPQRLDAGRERQRASARCSCRSTAAAGRPAPGNGPMYDGGAAGAARRRRGRDREPPARRVRLHAPRRGRRAEEFQIGGRLRRHGHGGVARMGARQHRELRRRSVARDDLRPVGRRLENIDAARRRQRRRACSIAPPCRVGSSLRLARRRRRRRNRPSSCSRSWASREDRVADIQSVPWEQLLEAQVDTCPAASRPVMDGKYLPHHPFDPVAPPESRDVPVIISTTLEDAALRLTNWDLDRRRPHGAGQRALQREGRRNPGDVPRSGAGEDAVSDPGADLHGRATRGAPSRRPSARRRRAGAGATCTSGNG